MLGSSQLLHSLLQHRVCNVLLLPQMHVCQCEACFLVLQTLRNLARQCNVRNLVVLRTSFEVDPYVPNPAARPLPGFLCLKDIVVMTHNQYAHIIDNKLMDLVSVRLLGV